MSRRRQSPVRVLIADDHLLFAEALEAILDSEDGLQVVGRAPNGAEAVRLARELVPDVVLLDISMPVLDGFGAAEQIADLPARSAVLMLTGSTAPHDLARARRAGVRGYITKDAIATRLVDAICDAAGG